MKDLVSRGRWFEVSGILEKLEGTKFGDSLREIAS